MSGPRTVSKWLITNIILGFFILFSFSSLFFVFFLQKKVVATTVHPTHPTHQPRRDHPQPALPCSLSRSPQWEPHIPPKATLSLFLGSLQHQAVEVATNRLTRSKRDRHPGGEYCFRTDVVPFCRDQVREPRETGREMVRTGQGSPRIPWEVKDQTRKIMGYVIHCGRPGLEGEIVRVGGFEEGGI